MKTPKWDDEELNAIMAEHQCFLSTIDAEKRGANVILTGLSKSSSLTTSMATAVSEEQKVDFNRDWM